MKLSSPLLSRLAKKYEPSTVVEMKFRRNDIAFRTDNEGNPVLLFIGKILPDGRIKGHRYTRTLIKTKTVSRSKITGI